MSFITHMKLNCFKKLHGEASFFSIISNILSHSLQEGNKMPHSSFESL